MGKRTVSALEELFALHVKAMDLPCPEREFRFHPVRRWRFDFAWPERKVAVEIEGGVWSKGRHTRGIGMIADMDKYNAAALDGWTLLRFSGAHVESGYAVNLIESVLKEKF